MASFDSKVIGYIATSSRTNVICTDVDACLVTGSEKFLLEYISILDIKNKANISIKEARFEHIVRGMRLGGKYAFDKNSFARFYPLGIHKGLLLENLDFNTSEKEGKFFTVRIDNMNF